MQRKACHKFAESMGWEIVQEEQEAGVSGFKVSAADREAIIKLKEDALKNRFDILLVFMFDRLGRKEDETPFIVEWFASHGIEVWSVKEGEQRFDQHVDFLMNYIRFWQASGESKKTSIRTKTALEQLVAEGRFRGGIAPYGYKLEPSGILNKRKHEVMKLVIEESEACAVRLMFHLCVNSGYGRCRIASALNDSGLKNRDGQNWHEATVGHNCGCRAATVRAIQIRDVDLDGGVVFYRHTKNRKTQVIPLCSPMIAILREYQRYRSGESTDYLFCTETGSQLTENGLRQSIARYNARRGVQKTSIHLFRHTFARKYLIDCGGDAFTLQKLLGHSTLAMAKHYCAIYDADLTKNYDNFSPLAQMKAGSAKIKMSDKRR